MRFTLIALTAFALAFALKPCSTQKPPQQTPQPSPPQQQPLSSPPPPVAAAAGATNAQSAGADLTIREYEFVPTDRWALRVNVANTGAADAGASVLRLKVTRIKGNPVGALLESEVPAIAAGGNIWVSLHTGDIVPKNVSLKETTFRLSLDVRNAVREADEGNNERWHNRNQPERQTADDSDDG